MDGRTDAQTLWKHNASSHHVSEGIKIKLALASLISLGRITLS